MDAKKKKGSNKSPSEYRELLGKRIRELRIKKGYTSLERFANHHDLDRTQMGRMERGANVQFENLVMVIQAFGITLREFFSEGFDEE